MKSILTAISSLALAQTAIAACPQFAGHYTLTSPQANFVTKLNVVQNSCNDIVLKLETDGNLSERRVIADGQPHVTYSSTNETITETFSWNGDKISYTSQDNLVWGEKFINQGIIAKNQAGQLTESYSQYRWDGIYLYTTKLIYSAAAAF